MNRFLAVVLLLMATSAGAATAGTWRPAGSMLHPRTGHTATLLNDGTVLIAGGTSGDQLVPEAEIFNPATGTSSPASSMFVPRSGHAAVLLTDGRVLIAGGFSRSNDALLNEPKAEIFDPATGRFSSAGTVHNPRLGPALVALPDGGAILLGGACAASVERFDPTTLTFQDGVSYLNFQFLYSPPAVTTSGRIVVAGGGYCSGHGPFSTVDVSATEPGGLVFSNVGRLGQSRMSHTTTSLGGELLLVAGGEGKDFNFYASPKRGPLDSAEIVDAATGKSRFTGSLHQARIGHSATLLATGEVLITGGYVTDSRGNAIPVGSTEIFDPRSEEFHLAGPLDTSVPGWPLVVTATRRILVFGSRTNGSEASVEEFVPTMMRRRIAQ